MHGNTKLKLCGECQRGSHLPHLDPRSLQLTAESRLCLKVDTRSSHCCQKLPCGPRDSVCAAWYVETWSVCEEQLKKKLGQGINGKIMGRSRQRTGFC